MLILAQRQAALVAKQAACLDVLSNGRLRLGVGVGWNQVEFTGLNEVFSNRGRRSEEQVQVMQALWSQPHVTFKGRYHTIDDAGINPRPASGRIPVWFGGHAEATLQRTAKYGDGWMPLAYPADETALAAFDKLRGLIKAEGRDPASVGLEVWLSLGSGDEAAWHRDFAFWKKAGVTHVTAHTTFAMNHHKRIAGPHRRGSPRRDHPVQGGGGGSAVSAAVVMVRRVGIISSGTCRDRSPGQAEP